MTSIEALCEEAFRAADVSNEGRLGLPQFRAALQRVFSQFGGRIPQPDESWFGKVFENYAPRCGGAANLKCLVDVAKQYVSHHERKANDIQHAARLSPTNAAPSPTNAAHAALVSPRTVTSTHAPSAGAPHASRHPVLRNAAAAGYGGPPVPTAGAATSGKATTAANEPASLGTVQVASQVMYPIIRDRLAIYEHYEFDGGTLGEGSFGSVSIVTHRTTGQKRACKTIGVETAEDLRLVDNEITLLKKLDHPHIIRLSEAFVDVVLVHGQHRGNIYLISELCLGGPLLEGFTRRGENGYGGEAVAASCLRQILSATAHCHSKGIIHRDLKPDNVIYASTSPDSVVKVIDFGLANFLQRLLPAGSYVSGIAHSMNASLAAAGSVAEKTSMQRAGTFLFMAPEMVQKFKYSEKVDLWAIGCILFLLATGVHPFWIERMRAEEVRERMLVGRVLDHPSWLGAPPLVRDLVQRLLTVDAASRPSAAEALQHTWLKSLPQSAALDGVAQGIPKGVFEGLRRYQASSKLKKAVLKLLAKEVDEARTQGLREVFKSIDSDQDGFVTRDQLIVGMRQHPEFRDFSSKDLDMVLPPRAKNRMSCNDFIAAMLVEQGFSRAELLNAFRRFDVRREGRISVEALSEVFKHAGSAAKLEAAFREADVGRHGFIDFDDFCALIDS